MKDPEFEIGDTVRFVAYKFDEDGGMTDKLMKVTGKLVEIEPIGSCSDTNFPTYHVNRNGDVFWYSGDKLQLIKKHKK